MTIYAIAKISRHKQGLEIDYEKKQETCMEYPGIVDGYIYL